ncbi:hypothetical protein DFJ73DRAFT_771397 [Zopfochytrium polystomum]|nr:hypothetical protein DFJ73DRAFT_771397 [Zopfochytrium polystomum]
MPLVTAIAALAERLFGKQLSQQHQNLRTDHRHQQQHWDVKADVGNGEVENEDEDEEGKGKEEDVGERPVNVSHSKPTHRHKYKVNPPMEQKPSRHHQILEPHHSQKRKGWSGRSERRKVLPHSHFPLAPALSSPTAPTSAPLHVPLASTAIATPVSPTLSGEVLSSAPQQQQEQQARPERMHEEQHALWSTLVALVDKLTLPIFCLEPPIANGPIEYYRVAESETYTIGLLVLKAGQTLPIHDHPGMSVMSKVIYGDLHVRFFELLEPPETSLAATRVSGGWPAGRFARVVSNRIISANTPESLLTIRFGSGPNLHSFSAHSDVVVILDLLGPPYDDDLRPCTYFGEPLSVSSIGKERELPGEASLDPKGMECNGTPSPSRASFRDASPSTASADSPPSKYSSAQFSSSSSVLSRTPSPQSSSQPLGDLPEEASSASKNSPELVRPSSDSGVDLFQVHENRPNPDDRVDYEGATVFLPFLRSGRQNDELDAFQVIARTYRGATVVLSDVERARSARDEALVKLGRGVVAVWDGVMEARRVRSGTK